MLVQTFGSSNQIGALDGPEGLNNNSRGRRVPRSGEVHGEKRGSINKAEGLEFVHRLE
ncbi:MAG: hypothetical protein KA239_02665 [Bacteroidia bacterium]|nr:hypothetical protein [Bacteroidia bacterium]